MTVNSLSRREALRRLIVGTGAAAAPVWVRMLSERALASEHPHSHARGQSSAEPGEWTPLVFNPHQAETTSVISEMIIPETETPGAIGAGVPAFVDRVLSESDDYPRQEFLKGLDWIDRRSNQLFGADFIAASPDQQTALLTILSSPGNRSLQDQAGVEFFQAIKSLTVTGYYTSEVGIYDELEGGELFFNDYPGCTHPEHQS